MSYWSAAEVREFVESQNEGFDCPDITDHLAAAISEFERRTGWNGYFVAQAATFYYTLTNQAKLVLDMPVISVTSLVIGGTTMTENTNFWMLPLNAARKVVIELSAPTTSARRAVVLTGVHGYAAECPDDVNIALAEVCMAIARDIVAGAGSIDDGGDAEKLKQGPVEITFKRDSGSGVGKGVYDRVPSFGAAVARYTRFPVM